MKKLVKIGASLILLVQSILLAWPVQAIQGQDQMGQDFEFFLNPPLVGDQSLSGEALPDQPITLEVQDQEFEVLVEEDGQFEFDPIPSLSEEDEILVKQGENEIESPVFTEDQAPDRVEFEGDFDFTGLVDLEDEGSDPESDQADEDESHSDQEAEDQTLEDPESDSDSEDDTTGEGEEEEDSEESESQAGEADQEEAEADDGAEDGGDPEEDAEVDDETEDNSEAESEVDDDTDDEETNDASEEDEEEDQAPGQSRASGASNASRAPGPTSSSARTAVVSNFAELRRAMEDPNIEIVRLSRDITTSSGASSNMPVASNSRRKILDGQGFSLIINQNAGFDTDTRIDDMVVRNFYNLYTRHSSNDEGFLRMRANPYNFHLENVTFNRNRNADGAHLFTSWESAIHFYGGINVYTPPNRQFVTRVRRAEFHDGSNVRINSGQIGIEQIDQGNVRDMHKGVVVGNNARLSILSGSHAFHNSFNGNGPTDFEVGKTSTVNLRSYNGQAIQINGSSNFNFNVSPDSLVDLRSDNGHAVNIEGNSNFNLTVDPNSNLKLAAAGDGLRGPNNSSNQVFAIDVWGQLNIEADRGIYFKQQAFRFTIHEGGQAKIDGRSNAVFKDDRRNPNRPQFELKPGSRWVARSRSGDTFRLLGQSDFSFDSPAIADFIAHQNGTVTFSTNANHRFRIQNVLMRSWVDDIYDYASGIQTQQFDRGQFTLTPDSFSEVVTNPASNFFPNQFPRNNRRWQFIEGLDDPVIDGPILDTMTEITGTAPADSTVFMTGEDSEVIDQTQADSQGQFKFTLDQPFPLGTRLTFYARRGMVQSGWVDEVVQGARLELTSVDNLNFETTEIKDQANQLIPKTQPVKAELLDTRQDQSWQLTVQAREPLTNQAGHQLPNALVYRNPVTNTTQVLEGQDVLVATDQSNNVTQTGDYTSQVTWAENEGFLIQTNPIHAQSGSPYKARIQWTLKDAP